MQCSNIWKFDGNCAGDVLYYRVSAPQGAIYDEQTKAPFEKSGLSVKGAFEVRSAPGDQTLITALSMSVMTILRQPSPGSRPLSMYFPFYSENVTARVASLTSLRRLQKYIAIRTETTSSATPNSPATYLVLLLSTVSGSKNS
jgi:hypothetical protein